MPIIVLVDDDQTMRDLYRMWLVKGGFVVHEANDGQEAIEVVGKVSPDLVIMDVMMPRLNGLDALLLLKSAEETKKIPVILVTALPQDLRQTHTAVGSADEYLLKTSMTSEQLLVNVQKYFPDPRRGKK